LDFWPVLKMAVLLKRLTALLYWRSSQRLRRWAQHELQGIREGRHMVEVPRQTVTQAHLAAHQFGYRMLMQHCFPQPNIRGEVFLGKAPCLLIAILTQDN